MINSRTYIRDKKRTVAAGEWTPGPIPKRAFPLFKDKSPLNSLWQWRAATLQSETANYRLLVMLRTDKPNFKAWLALQVGEDWAVMGRLEWHGNHGQLHCHMQCAKNGIAVNEIEPAGCVSIPHWKAYHRERIGVESTKDAWHLALKFFRAQAAEVGTLL